MAIMGPKAPSDKRPRAKAAGLNAKKARRGFGVLGS